jgi:maltose-binding protein MalE
VQHDPPWLCKRDKLNKKQLSAVGAAYEPYFLEELDPAIPWLAKNKTKICVNAGASDVQGLAEAVKKLTVKHGVDLKVGYVDGDDVTDAMLELYNKGKLCR